MAYVNVAEWTSQHVGDWLYGLDDSILPYVQFFVNNQINGCRLLLLSAHDLSTLNVHKIGHQEIILEAVELLRNLHYNISSETLQTIALRLACKSRALFNQLKKWAEKIAAANSLHMQTEYHNGENFNNNINNINHNSNNNNSNKKNDKNKDKDKEKDKELQNNQIQQPTVDMSPVSTATLAAVSDILSAVKDLISWIDRYPFDGQDKYVQARKAILQLAIELTSTAQRDQQFVQAPNEVIKQSCKKLADLCDRLVQEINDSLAMQAASLEVVTVTKNMDEDLGMHIHSSYSGIHVVGGLKFDSPAHLNGNIEEGDEIVQVNYQTVVGWQLKKLVASMRRFPTKLILTVKKRPRHHQSGSFTVLPQFALPMPEMSIIGNSSLPIGTYGSTNYIHNNHSNNNMISMANGFTQSSNHHLLDSIKKQQNQQQQQQFVLNNQNEQQEIDLSQNKLQTSLSSSTIMITSVPINNTNTNAQVKSNNDEQIKHIDHQQQASIQCKQNSSCSSSDESSPLSELSYDDDDDDGHNSSTTFSTESDSDNSDNDNRHHHHNHHHHHRHSHRISQQMNRRCTSSKINYNNNNKNERKSQKIKNTSTTTSKTMIENVNMKQSSQSNNNYCSWEHGSEYEIEDIDNDNDSAFYSGRRTTTSTCTSISSTKNENSSENSAKSSNNGNIYDSTPLPSSSTAPTTMTTTTNTAITGPNQKMMKNLTTSLVKVAISKSKLKQSDSIEANDPINDSTVRERDDNNDVVDDVHHNPINQVGLKPRTSAEFEELYLMQQNAPSVAKTANKIDTRTHLTPVQLSTITHLTSLAKNIRFANMTQVQNRTSSSSSSSSWMANNTHSKAKFDPALARQIEQTILRLSNGDLVMGDYEGHLYTYKGSERIGGNSADVSSLGMIDDPKQLEKWSKIRSVLRDNCLYAYNNDSKIACFEIPIHLPGYYILVDKQMLLSEPQHSEKTVKRLVIFKLVTYHRLFMFAVESLSELVRWIVRFGYRFCCNPTEPQLCFTYYLSPVHIGELPPTSSATLTSQRSFVELSESDDYHELLTVKSNDSTDGSNHVKFQIMNGRDSSSTSDDNNKMEKDAHRFIKSPHPKGSIRFAVCRHGQERDFIDATVDVKKILAAQNLEIKRSVEKIDSTTATTTTINATMPRPKPRISKMAVMNGKTSADDTMSSSNTASSASSSIASKTSTMITSAAQRLAPIPLPEKSTHISQTIQHFANLQRQNNLRRSFAQQQQQQQQNLSMIVKNAKTLANNQKLNYADYDYIINNRPKVCVEESINNSTAVSTTTTTTTSATVVTAVASNTIITNNTIGNPLYCHVSPVKNNTELQPSLKNTVESLSSSSSSTSSSSDQDESSQPPSINPPPPPPPRTTVNSESNPEWSNHISSPRLQAKRFSVKKQSISNKTNNDNDKDNNNNDNNPPIVPPKPSRNDSRKDKNVEAPPTLLPRCPIMNQNQPTPPQPPPLPSTSHPQLFRSNSSSQQQSQQQQMTQSLSQPPPLLPPPPPPICPKPDLIKCLAEKKSGTKFLNRSFSDAAYQHKQSITSSTLGSTNIGRQSLKSRHSLESSNSKKGQHKIDNYDDDDDNINHTFYRTGSVASFGDVPSTPTSASGWDISSSSTSGRSLPTMGVSMLAKKRLSNVSADSSAIEKAINLHHSNNLNTSITSG